ncbi:MAG: hypothetical protein QX190_04985 [Methylococcales bacterium]
MNKKILLSAIVIFLSGCCIINPNECPPAPCKNPNGCPPPPPSACSFDFELVHKYTEKDYQAIKVGLGMDVGALGGGNIETGLVSDHLIDMIIEKSNDPVVVKASSAMHWAVCLEETYEKRTHSEPFISYPLEKQNQIKEELDKKVDNFRTRALDLVLEKQGVNVVAPSSNPSDKAYTEAVLNETKKVTQNTIVELKTQQTTAPATVPANPNSQTPKATQETIQVLEKQVQEVTKEVTKVQTSE